jgi:hypothetical protein
MASFFPLSRAIEPSIIKKTSSGLVRSAALQRERGIIKKNRAKSNLFRHLRTAEGDFPPQKPCISSIIPYI